MTRRSDLQKGIGPTGELGPNPACLFLSEQVPLVWELVQRMEVPFLVFTKALLPHRTLQTATSLLSTTFCFTQWIPVGAAYSYKMCGLAMMRSVKLRIYYSNHIQTSEN